jgi:iron complex outermembrane receptor protein
LSDSSGLGGKVTGLVGYRSGAFDATVGAAYEAHGAFYDGHGRHIGVDGAQGEIQDSKSWWCSAASTMRSATAPASTSSA